MPDEDMAPESQDTPTPEAGSPETGTPATDPAQESVDFEKRYNDLRPQWDRANQRLSELESFFGALTDPETQAQALSALGLEIADDDTLYDEDDEVDPDERIERIEQFLASQQEAEQDREIQSLEREYVNEAIAEVSKAQGIELSAEERTVVETLAKHPEMRDEDGIPDVEAAFEAFMAAQEANLNRYRNSKKAPRVELGQAGTEKINLADDEARVNATAAIIEAARQSESI